MTKRKTAEGRQTATLSSYAGRVAPPEEEESGNLVGLETDWDSVERQVRMLSRAGDNGVRLQASPEEILAEAHRLAAIYQKAGKPLPDTLAALA